MVTKRYIKRGGKTFGPYYYESYRDKKGRVKKRYLKNYKPSKKKKVPIALSIALITLILITIGTLYLTSQKTHLNNITGKTVFSDIKTQYSPGERLGGEILLNLKKGELMPANTNVIISLGDEQEEFILSNFVDYQKTKGKFYTEGTEISGSGEGYGIPGTRIVNPTVEFEIELYGETETEEPTTSSEEIPSSIEETSAPTEETLESSEETPAEETEQTETSDETTITGQTISETSEIISGDVSAGEDFSFEVPADKQARVVEGSVKSNGETLPDDTISIEIEDGLGIISTDYEIEEEGFGPEYLGDVELTFEIDIEDLEFNALPGDLTIQLVYDDNIITSYEEKINVLTTTQDQNDTDPEENATIIQTQDIPLVRIPSDGSTTIDMNEYFSGAESYVLNAENITATVEDNLMTITPNTGFRGARKATITAQAKEEKLESNEFLILVSSGAITIKTTKQTIKVGEPVKWTKEITLENPEQINVEIPLDAENIQIKKKQGEEYVEEEVEQTQSPITGNVVVEVKLKKPDTIGKKPSQLIELFLWLKKKIKSPPITGQAIANSDSSDQTLDIVLEGTANEYIIEYETPAPETFEELVSENEKRITISAPDELAYTDIIASTTLNNQISINEPQNIKLYWLTEQEQIEQPEIAESLTETPAALPETQVVEEVQISAEGEITTLTESQIPEEQTTTAETIRQEIPFDSYDLDLDNNIDYIEWIVPHLSNQTYELVIVNADITANITEEATFSHLAINTATSPYTNLVAYYSFDGDAENTQSATHYDFTTYSNDGTGQSQAVVNSTNCIYDKCTHLDGSGDYILIPSAQSLEFNSNNRYSWSFWVKPKLGSYMALISDGLGAISSSPGGYYFFIEQNGEICTTSELGANLCTGNGQLLKNNAWSHVVITYDGKGNGQGDSIEIKVYINGTFMDDLFSSDPSGTDWFGSSGDVLLGYYIGSDSWAESYFNGSLDEAMFFNETLNSTQIQSIYNNQSARFKSTGEITFTNFGDLSNYTTTNLSLTDCKTFQSTNIKGKINNGAYQTFSNCQATGYELTGISGLSNANLTVQLNSDSNNFYTPLAIQNTTINAFEDILVVSDCTTIGLPNKIYRLNQSIPGAYMQGGGACITLNANAHNTTLDLNGYTIGGISDDSQEEYYGVLVSANNVTIKNGILSAQNYGIWSSGNSTKIKNMSISALSYVNCYTIKGVYISGANAAIENSSITAVCVEDEGVTPPPTDCDVYGIYLSGNNDVIENSSSYASCAIFTRNDCLALSTGIYLGGNNSIVRNSKSLDNWAGYCYDAEQQLYNADSGGLFINNSVGNQIFDSQFSTGAYGNGGYSIYINGKGSNNLTNVNVTRTALYITGASNNILTNITAIAVEGSMYPVEIRGSVNNTLKIIRIQNSSTAYNMALNEINNSYVEDVLIQGRNFGSDRGVLIYGYNNQIINLTMNRTQGERGIQISGRNNTFDTFRITTGSSLFDITGTVNDTTFIDLQQIGNYSLSGTAIFRNRNYGEIRFLQEINGSGTNLTSDIRIENDSVTVLSTSNIGLNRSANITLYGLPNFSNPAILKDGALCTDCYNFTSLNAGTVIFNVTSWTNYSIGENPVGFTLLTACQNLTQANTTYTLQNPVSTNGTCFHIKANNITLNCQNWNNTIRYGNISTAYPFYGIYSDMNDTTIRNCEIIKINPTQHSTGAGIYLANNWRNLVENVNVSDNTYGIALDTTALTNVTNITANSNQFGIYLTGVGQRYLSNIIANSNNRSGIFSLTTVSNVTIINTTANLNGDYGIQLTASAYSSTLYNVTTNNNNGSGIVIGGANNNLTLITTNSNAGSGLELGSGTTINQLTANSNNDSGLNIAGSSSTVYNATLNNNTKGIYAHGSVTYNNLTNINIDSSRGNAIEFNSYMSYGAGITDNIFSNISVTNTNSSSYDLYTYDEGSPEFGISRNYFVDSYFGKYYITGSSEVTFYFKDTNEGEIKFLSNMAGANGTNLSNDIRIGNNSAYVNSAIAGLNKSANITLYNLPTNFVSPNILKDSAICPASICHNFTSLNAGTVVFNVTSWSTYSIGSDTIAPSISFAQPTENDNELTDANSIYINVSVINDSDRDSTVFSLYTTSLTLIDTSTFTNATNSINFTNLSAGTYVYIVSINDTVGNSDTTGSRSITLLPSCLNASTCVENSSCTVNTRCVLHSELCTNNECDFTNMTVNSTIFTLYDSSGNGRNLKLTMTATSPRAPLVFLNRSSVVFSGKRGSNIGSGSLGGNAGIVNITVPRLFNTTNANFTGVGGYTTLSQNTGGNGGILQLNYHGLIRNFTSPTPQPNLAAGSSVDGLYGSPGRIIYNKDLTTLPRDADVTGDGIIDIIGDIVAIRNNYNKVNGESGYDLSKDINNDNKVNVIEIAKIGFEMGTR